MINWLIVALDLIVILECVGIALWFAVDLRNRLMRSVALCFSILALGFLLFALPRDFLFALDVEVESVWFVLRPYSILPWRLSMAGALGMFLLIMRFGDWKQLSRGG